MAATAELIASPLDTLPADCRRKLESYAKAIDRARQRGVDAIMEIGKQLESAQELLASHDKTEGTFCSWAVETCGSSKATVYNYLGYYKAFSSCPSLRQHASSEALYFLARDTTPEAAIERAVEAAEAGERVTLKRAKEFVKECTLGDEDDDDDDDDGPLVPPFSSLTDAIDALDAAVAAIYLRWPSEYQSVLGDKLIALGEELNEKGKLVC